MRTFDTVIVGGGVIGTACLYHLVRKGIGNVLLIEKDKVAGGSTAASVAIIETQYLDPNQVALTSYGKKLCDEFERDSNLTFVHHGYLRMGHSQEDIDRFRESLDLQRSFGITGALVLTPDQIAEQVPGLVTSDLAGALWGPDDGYVDAVQYCEIFVGKAREGGATVRSQSAVTGFLVEDDGGVGGVTVGDEEIRCNRVINASGAWARGLGRTLGLEIPVDGYRRQVGIYAPPAPLRAPLPFVIDYVPGVEHEGLYFRDDSANRVIAGLHWEGYADWERPENPDSFPTGMEWEYGARLFDMLCTRFEPAVAYKPRGGWSGLYPMTPDGELIVGETPSIPRLYNALGGCGVGVQTAAGIGSMIADILVSGELALVPDPQALALSRFVPDIPSSQPDGGRVETNSAPPAHQAGA